MPRYFFNLYDDLDVFDEEGIDLADLAAAEVCGLQNARDMAAEEVRQGKLDLKHRIEIADELGKVLRTILFADAVAVVT